MSLSASGRPARASFGAKGTGARLRSLLLAGAAALTLAACTGDDGPSLAPGAKAMKPLSPKTVALIGEKGMSQDSPIVVRIFKEESELEVWKENTSGDFALLKTYPICRWSGELGPKVKEGDRQAPEGFYTITPGQMNANSSYYLAFDLGFPNAYDRAWGRTGANLMVHGDCSSSGCYAMTDEQVQEIFALGRESFRGGQRSFQVQAYPFRMTSDNLVRHRNNPNLAFWQMLKEGSDTFEITKQIPKVDVCGKRYVFNATPTDPNGRFDARAACPAYTQPGDLEETLAARKAKDDQKIASAGSAPSAPIKTGKDGGMHKVFLAKLENPELKAPGSLPAVVKPPGSDYGVATNAPAPAESIALASADMVPQTANVPLPAARPADAPAATSPQIAAAPSEISLFGRPAAPAPTTQIASIEEGGGFLSSVSKFFGRSESVPEAAPVAAAPGAVPVAAAPASPAPASSATSGLSAITNWLSGKSAEPAPASAPLPAAPQAEAAGAADVPVPPVRPPVPRASAPAPQPVIHAARPAPQQPAHPAPAPAATAAASTPVAAPTQVSAPELRPSVAPTGRVVDSSAGPSASGTLPGPSILSTGTFSSSVQ